MMLDGISQTGDDFHRESNHQMDISSCDRQKKFSKMKTVNEDGPKSLKRASTSENVALEQETQINRKIDKWTSLDGQFSELAGSISSDLHARRNQTTSVSPKRCWSQSNRSLSRSPSRVSTFGSKRWENRGRSKGGLVVHDGDFPDSKGFSKRSNWDGMAAVETTRRSGVTNKEINGLVPALDQSDDLGRSVSPGPESWRRHVYSINLKHGCSRSERNFISNKDGAKMSNWETASGDYTTNEDGYSKRHGGGWGAALDQFEELDRSISVDHQRWRQRSHSISPKHSWSMRKRSRSPSPPLGLKSGIENWNIRGRTSTGGSAAAYRDFATEKFGKGSHFRELSEDDLWRHSDNTSREFGGGRFERGRYSRYHSRESFDDLLEQKDFSRNRLLQREPSLHDDNREKHEHHQNKRSSDHHYISAKERHPRVSTCNYDHHDDDSRSIWSRRDGAREINYDRRDADSPFRQRLKSRRVSDTPCKYFAVGHCRRGEDCKFSHQPLHGHRKSRQQDDKKDYNMRTETATSLIGSERVNWVSTMDAHISSHGMHNRNDSRMSNSSSMDDEFLRKSKDGQCKASQSPEQKLTHDASEHYDSAISADVMSKCTYMEQIISNEEQTSSKGGCVVGDTARSKTEMDFATIPFAAVSFTEKSLSRSRSEQQLDPELHSFASSAQDMKGASLSPSGKTVQETVCLIASNGDSQLGISQILSPTNQQMHFASRFGHSEQIQQSPVSLSQHVVPKGRCNQQMDPAAQVADSELIQQSPLSCENGVNQHIVPKGQCNQPKHSAVQVGHNEHMQQSPVSDKNSISQSIADSVVPEGRSNQVFSQDNPNIQPILISDDESDQQADDSNERTSQVTTGTSASQVVVITDEVAHVTNLLSSPSQVWQQPSQLQAILTPIGSTGSTLSQMTSKPSMLNLPSAPLVSSLGGSHGFVAPHHNQTPASNCYKDTHLDDNENRQNKILESHCNQTQVSENCYKGAHSDEDENRQNGNLELKRVEDVEEVTVSIKSAHSDEDENRQNGKLELKQVGVVEEVTVSIKSSHSDENENTQNGKSDLKQVEHVEEVTVSITSQNEKVHVPSTEEVDHDAQINGRNKNTKETNGMKMFKFALVEFVKDQLKPTWKEGHLSREAHKAIVKKVVDKVTDSVKGPNFPQTQHKINQYMEHSKSKLTKLVQAYVARSIKSSPTNAPK